MKQDADISEVKCFVMAVTIDSIPHTIEFFISVIYRIIYRLYIWIDQTDVNVYILCKVLLNEYYDKIRLYLNV